MDEEHPRNQGSQTTPERLHEPAAINVRAAALTGVGLLISLALASAAMLVFYGRLAESARAEPVRRPQLQPPGRPRMPFPALIPDPARERERAVSEQRAVLEGFGWIDAERGVARVPISRAMDLLVEHGMGGIGPWTETTYSAEPAAPAAATPAPERAAP